MLAASVENFLRIGGDDYIVEQRRLPHSPINAGCQRVAADLKGIYRAATERQAEQELTDFIVKWGDKYQAIGKLCLAPGAGCEVIRIWSTRLERVIAMDPEKATARLSRRA